MRASTIKAYVPSALRVKHHQRLQCCVTLAAANLAQSKSTWRRRSIEASGSSTQAYGVSLSYPVAFRNDFAVQGCDRCAASSEGHVAMSEENSSK